MSDNHLVYKEEPSKKSTQQKIRDWNADPIQYTSDSFWSNDISIIFKRQRWTEFFPTRDMSFEEQLNSISRLGIYIGIILIIWNRKIHYIFI